MTLSDNSNQQVTLFIGTLGGGGAEGVCINLANAFAAKGWTVNLVVMNLKKINYLDNVDPKVNLVNLDISNARYALFALKRHFSAIAPQPVLVFNYELVVLLVIVRKLFRINIKVIARNINTLSAKQQQAVSFWRKYVVVPLIIKFYSKADFVVNQCREMQEDLINCTGISREKTGFIYNPVNAKIEKFSMQHNVSAIEREDFILCIGRLEQQKATHIAIEAFAKVTKKYPTLRLKIVGTGALESGLRSLCDELNVTHFVDFEGFQSDVIPYYSKARLTLLTSLFEGFPNVLVESIALGTPVVSVDCPSGPREIITGDNGFLVPLNNKDALVQALAKALSKDWDTNAIVASSKRFSLQHAIEKYQELLY